MLRPFSSFLLLLLSPIFAGAQASTANTADAATVTFALDFPASQPEHYSIHVPSAGPAHYESSGRLSADSDDTDSFEFDFPLSAATRSSIFALAGKSGYFERDLDSHKKNLAFTGNKVLSYKDGRRSGESTYNYSTNAAAQELTSLFQSLSATLEFGHRLDYYLRYQKLALDRELKRMDEMARSHTLIEVTAVEPILQKIIADPAVINVTRARAQRLLETPSAKP
jgi:hypothetical protein